MKYNDLVDELKTNFIEYAVAVNTDRSIPDAKSGLKPVAKRILFGALRKGYVNSKPHVKCARIVGDVMGELHPHGDSSIYGALVRLSQPWSLRYPLIDFHGSNGNIDGDGPAAYRYTEARLSKIAEEGMLSGIKKNNVDFVPNYDETIEEPVTLPALFPNLLCNPNSGIGVAMACNWACHNLSEVANAIYDYMDDKEPMLPGPDFPMGGQIINKKDIPNIMKTGRGSVKIRARYEVEKDNIVFYELPYGVNTETIMTQIGDACDEGKITGVDNIRNESNRKGFRLVIETDGKTSIKTIVNKIYKETNMQTSFAYNQVALVDKVPTELNLKQCIKIYVDHNSSCIVREAMFDIKKAEDRLHIIIGLLKALDIIDDIIAMIKASASAAVAKTTLMTKWGFSENQAKAILDMKLSKLAKLEKEDLENEKKELEALLAKLQEICTNPLPELRKRLEALVKKYGDERRTELIQVEDSTKEEEEIKYVEPEKCVVVMTESGLIKRIPSTSFRKQRRNGKGVKTQDDITNTLIRTNTIDNIMVFTNKGKMYRILVDNIPVGTNVSQGVPIKSLIEMEVDEVPTTIYSIYRDTDAKYVLFITKNGLVKKTALEEYTKTKKKTGIAAINIKDGDSIACVHLIKDEPLVLVTKDGMAIRFNSTEIGASGRTTMGVKGITLKKDDKVVMGLPVRNNTDSLAIFSASGLAKKVSIEEFPIQKRAGKGLICYKPNATTGDVVSAALVSDEDSILVCGTRSGLCISAQEIPELSRVSTGNQIIKGNINSVSKV